jgi:hypothetical protein
VADGGRRDEDTNITGGNHMNFRRVFTNGRRSITAASLATLCAGALAVSACGGGGSSGIATFCKDADALGNSLKAINSLPAYQDMSKSQAKALVSQVHGVAKSAPKDITIAATAMSAQIDLAIADGSEDDTKLASAAAAVQSYATDHCTSSGEVKAAAAVVTTATTGSTPIGDSGSSVTDNSGSDGTQNTATCVTDDTGFCATGDTSSSGSSDNSQTCITEITGNCDPTNGFARLNPLNIGSSKTLGDWTVTVVSFEPNANSEVEAAQLADVVPGPGATFALIELRATYNGAGLGNASDLDVQIVGSDRQT